MAKTLAERLEHAKSRMLAHADLFRDVDVTVAPAVDAEDVERAEAALGRRLPESLRQIYLTDVGGFQVHWETTAAAEERVWNGAELRADTHWLRPSELHDAIGLFETVFNGSCFDVADEDPSRYLPFIKFLGRHWYALEWSTGRVFQVSDDQAPDPFMPDLSELIPHMAGCGFSHDDDIEDVFDDIFEGDDDSEEE